MGGIELLFTNRELAVIIWAAAGLMFALAIPGFRHSLLQAFRVAANKHFVVGALSIIAWNLAAVLLFRSIGLWTLSMLLTTIVSIVHCFGSVGRGVSAGTTLDLRFYWSTVTRHVGVTALLGFILELSTFGLITELALTLGIIALSGLLAITESKPLYDAVAKMCAALLAGIGFLMLLRGGWGFYVGWGTWSLGPLLIEMLMPAVIALAFLPALVTMTAYAAYEEAFIRMPGHAAGKDNPSLVRAKKWLLITRFGLNLKWLQQFRRSQAYWPFVAARDQATSVDLLERYAPESFPVSEMS